VTLGLMVLAFFAIGAGVHRRWVLALPVVLGALAAIAIAARSQGLGDTPIPFAVIIATVATAAGIRTRKPQHV
jgi:hypothetical protein